MRFASFSVYQWSKRVVNKWWFISFITWILILVQALQYEWAYLPQISCSRKIRALGVAEDNHVLNNLTTPMYNSREVLAVKTYSRKSAPCPLPPRWQLKPPTPRVSLLSTAVSASGVKSVVKGSCWPYDSRICLFVLCLLCLQSPIYITI